MCLREIMDSTTTSTTYSEDIYLPGDKICAASNVRAGHGTYIRDGFVYASLAGHARLDRDSSNGSNSSLTNNNGSFKSSTEQLNVKTSLTMSQVSIKTLKGHSVVLPHIGSLVMAKITSVNPRYAKCSILSVNNAIVKEKFSGQINRKDIRATEKDKIEVNKSFRCGDVIIARVISLGDMNSYFLSTAENELGVVIAYSESAGVRMLPTSWNEMQCPLTMLIEQRKVAKVQPEFIHYVVEQAKQVSIDDKSLKEEEGELDEDEEEDEMN